MQTVILAAGTGSRLKHLTTELPKALIPLSGIPLIRYAIGFAAAVHPGEVIVVTGAFREKVEAVLREVRHPKLRWVHNPDFLKGNLYSLGAARSLVSDGFLLMNTDHVYRRAIADKVAAQCRELTAFCDQDRKLCADDMKVLTHPDGRLAEISKGLTRFDRGYVGMTFCPHHMLSSYWAVFDRVAAAQGEKAVVEMVLADLARQGTPPMAGDISGVGWLEIDTPDELAAAEAALAGHGGEFPVAPLRGK
jgi:choline kinase